MRTLQICFLIACVSVSLSISLAHGEPPTTDDLQSGKWWRSRAAEFAAKIPEEPDREKFLSELVTECVRANDGDAQAYACLGASSAIRNSP